MGVAEILTFLSLLFKTALLLYDRMKQTPVEVRSQSLKELDDAITLAKDKNDVTALSQWLGKGI